MIRLIAQGSVDEGIYEMAERKKLLSSAVLDKQITGNSEDTEKVLLVIENIVLGYSIFIAVWSSYVYMIVCTCS